MENLKKHKHYWLSFIFLVVIGNLSNAQECFTIYLVRHAEKQVSEENPKDPDLTTCGYERAEHLSEFFKSTELTAVYSTNYIRTIKTADPTAKSKSLKVEFYNPRSLELFAQELIDKSETVLVVGHSNTTSVLAGLLGETDAAPYPMTESDYNRIYQVVVCGELRELNLFYSSFSCEN